MDILKEQKSSLVKSLHNSVKLCQAEFFDKSEVVTESNLIVASLCKEWENIFLHGIRKKVNRNILSIKNSIIDVPSQLLQQIKSSNLNVGTILWLVICEFMDSSDLEMFNQIENDIGKFRAWLRTTINEHTLERFLIKLLSNPCQMILSNKYYESHALLLDHDENGVLPNLAAGISSIMFSLDITDMEILNQPVDNAAVNRSQHNSSSSSNNSRLPLFSSSTNGSFEDIDIDTNNDNNNSKVLLNNKRKNRIINILTIEDDDDDVDADDDSKSDSSDLYSPFSLFKTGLNFVSKFPFVNEEKLMEVKEEQMSNGDLDTTLSEKKHLSSVSQLFLKDTNNNNISSDDNDDKCDIDNDDVDDENNKNQFKDCRLSLKTDFYSSFSDTGSSGDRFNEVELVASDFSKSKEESSSLDTESSRITMGNLKDEVMFLKNQIELMKKEQESKYSDILNKYQQSVEYNQTLQRENDLLRNRLKYYLAKEDQIDLDNKKKEKMKQNYDSGLNDKIEQLVQMHTDLLELNEQLQRSLVDKDVTIGMLQSKVAMLIHTDDYSGVHIDGIGTVHVSIDRYMICGSEPDIHSREFVSYQIQIFCSPAITSNLLENASDPEFDSCSQWTTQRRFREFYKFYTDLPIHIRRIVSFPSRWSGGLRKKLNDEQLEERRTLLETFLRHCVEIMLQSNNNDQAHNRLSKQYLIQLIPILKENEENLS